MQAVMRVNTFDPIKLANSSDQIQEFDRLHAKQPGFMGTVAVELGGGRRFVLNLWETERHREDGLEALAPTVERLINPLLTQPSELICMGDVLDTDLSKAIAEAAQTSGSR